MKSTLTLLLSLFFLHGIYSQTPDTLSVSKLVAAIKNNANTFQKIEKQNDSTGTKYVYVKNKKLQFITISTIDNGYKKEVAWYYSAGILIYADQYWTDPVSKKLVDKQKCYLKDGHLIMWLDANDKPVDPNSATFKEVGEQLLTFAKKWAENSMK